jgi:phage-related protein (TIGR01555 family)
MAKKTAPKRKTAKRASAKKKGRTETRQDSQRRMVQERADGWRSLLSGLNTSKDKRTYSTFYAEATNWVENLEMWRGDDLAGRIVETIPNEMIREGWALCIDGDDGKEIEADVMAFLEELDTDRKLWQGLCLERAVGGAGLVMGINDLKTMVEPLDVSMATEMNFLEVFEPSELQVCKWQNDPTKKGFGQPLTYRLNPVSPGGTRKAMGVEIHESRIIIFPGIRVTRRQVTSQSGWGDAILTRCRDVLRDFQTAWASAGLLVADFAQSIWKIKGLAEIVALDKNEELANRIAAMELARSIVRATVIDAEGEEFERKQTPINGLSELLDRFATRLAASADMPVTLLMGMSPAGLNATGDSDIRTFYDRVRSMQRRKLKPALEKLVRVAFGALAYEEPDDWSIEFNPLWQPTEAEQATARMTQMQIDQGYIDMQVYTPDEVRNERFGGRKFSFDMHVEPDSSAVDPEAMEEYPGMMEGAMPPGALPPGAPGGSLPPGTEPPVGEEIPIDGAEGQNGDEVTEGEPVEGDPIPEEVEEEVTEEQAPPAEGRFARKGKKKKKGATFGGGKPFPKKPFRGRF